MTLTEEERARVAANAVREAEIAQRLAQKSWRFVSVSQISVNDLLYDADYYVASLLVDIEEWKRRAAKHGCNVDDGDPDCG